MTSSCEHSKEPFKAKNFLTSRGTVVTVLRGTAPWFYVSSDFSLLNCY